MKKQTIYKKSHDKIIIFTAHIENIEDLPNFPKDYAVIAADAGYRSAQQLGYSIDFTIGDYDTCPPPKKVDILLPSVKDSSDSEAAIGAAYSMGFREIYLIGGLGGRFDHTMGNIGLLSKYAGKCKKIALVDGRNYVRMLLPGKHFISPEVFDKNFTYLGLIAYGNNVSDLTINGCKYSLTNQVLTPDTTLGISNEIVDDYAEISFSYGKLLCILSSD